MLGINPLQTLTFLVIKYIVPQSWQYVLPPFTVKKTANFLQELEINAPKFCLLKILVHKLSKHFSGHSICPCEKQSKLLQELEINAPIFFSAKNIDLLGRSPTIFVQMLTFLVIEYIVSHSGKNFQISARVQNKRLIFFLQKILAYNLVSNNLCLNNDSSGYSVYPSLIHWKKNSQTSTRTRNKRSNIFSAKNIGIISRSPTISVQISTFLVIEYVSETYARLQNKLDYGGLKAWVISRNEYLYPVQLIEEDSKSKS